MSTEIISWGKCSRCKDPIERGSDGHIFCFYPNNEYTYTVMGRYCKTCTAELFKEMDLEILLKELTHLSLNFNFAFPLLLKKLNNASELPQEKKSTIAAFPIADHGPNVSRCRRCRTHIYYNRDPRVHFIEREKDEIEVYCQECCKIIYTRMNILEMVEEMMARTNIQKIGFNVLKERLNRGAD